jgi:mannosyl-oligosaccharide alpha-1,2-mannosidase
LSHYTGNETYGKLTEGGVIAVAQLVRSQFHLSFLCPEISIHPLVGLQPAPLPGLAGQNVDPTTGQFTNLYVTWGAGSDSYFEYLIKYARYTNNANTIFVDSWKVLSFVAAMNPSHDYICSDTDCRGLVHSHIAQGAPSMSAGASFVLTCMQTSTVGGHMYLADYDAQQRIRHVGS